MFALGAAMFAIAVMYASVGQAGGTGYVAVMGLAGFAPEVVKPTALALNIVVASVGSLRFARAGLLRREQCMPFVFLGAPFSVLGGAFHLPSRIYAPAVGVLLALAAVQIVVGRPGARPAWQRTPFLPALLTGAVIGFVSGVTGVGGGIFLAPMLIALEWTPTIREAAAVSAVFNLLNSVAALAGAWSLLGNLPHALPWWIALVFVGGLLGSWLSLRRVPTTALRYLLAAILLASSVRLLVG